MQPNDKEVGIILEAADIEVANQVHATLWEVFDSGKPIEDQSPIYQNTLLPNDDGVLVLSEEESRQIAFRAGVARRETANSYDKKSKKLSSLMGQGLFHTDELQLLELELPELEVSISAFASFVTASEACVTESQELIQNRNFATTSSD